MKLPPTLDSNSTAELYLQLDELLSSGTLEPLDGSAVISASAPALQLLAVFAQECQRRGLELAWEGPSSALLDAARQLAMENLIGIKEA